jgi:hypothetical protein
MEAAMQQHSRRQDVRRTVDAIDETRRSEHFRNPDRPDAMFVRPRRGRQDPEVIKAQTRLRTAHWRNQQDRRGAPTTYQIGMSVIAALVTSRIDDITEADRGLVGAMLTDLQARGFSIDETKAVLRKLRNRMVDPADRAGEPVESTRARSTPSAGVHTSSLF